MASGQEFLYSTEKFTLQPVSYWCLDLKQQQQQQQQQQTVALLSMVQLLPQRVGNPLYNLL